MLAPVRFVAVIAAVIAAMAWPGLASADVEADCRSDQAARVVQACSELMRTTGRSAADRIGFLDRRSRAHVELNAIGAAEADVAEIFKLDANSPVAFYARGRIRQARSETAAALADYNESHLRAADKYEPLIERGRFYLRMSEFDKARADFDAALHLNATKAAPYVGRALAQSGKGDTSAAMRAPPARAAGWRAASACGGGAAATPRVRPSRPQRRSSTTGCRRDRRGRPHRSPRCACGRTQRGRAA